MNSKAIIEIQLPSGNWIAVKTIDYINDSAVFNAMRAAKHTDKTRVRAIDNNNKIIDILN